jgi:hypothetical protein
MKKKQTKYYLILGLFFIGYLAVQYFKPEKINWEESYSLEHKTPYGAYILHELISGIFPPENITVVKEPLYTYLVDKDLRNTSYLIINNEFEPDPFDQRELLRFVSEGNEAFIAARFFSFDFADTLRFETDAPFWFAADTDSGQSRFLNPLLPKGDSLVFKGEMNRDFFSAFDTTKSTVLALNDAGKPNLIRVRMGSGSFFLCASPAMLSNYYLLEGDNPRFASNALSYLDPENSLIWDEYYKALHLFELYGMGQKPLRYLLRQPAFKWAFYLAVVLIGLYVLVEIKRKQRIIPVVKPLPNYTLEFVETIGRLYFQSKNHKNIAEKKIKVLLEHVRSQYFLKTHTFTEEFLDSLSGKSGVERGKIAPLFKQIVWIRTRDQITEEDLISLTKSIDSFYAESAR